MYLNSDEESDSNGKRSGDEEETPKENGVSLFIWISQYFNFKFVYLWLKKNGELFYRRRRKTSVGIVASEQLSSILPQKDPFAIPAISIGGIYLKSLLSVLQVLSN